MRHPVDRIISLYWFEGRWPRIGAKSCEDKRNKTAATKVLDFNDWIDAVYNQYATTSSRDHELIFHSNCGQWQSVENYYIRQLTGVDRYTTSAGADTSDNISVSFHKISDRYGDLNGIFRNVTLDRSHLELAKDVLAGFDLVIILEQLNKNEELRQMVFELTGGNHNSRDDYFNNLLLTKSREGLERNGKEYVPPTKEEIRKLTHWNRLDI